MSNSETIAAPATAVILTCKNDRMLADMLADAIARLWPGVTPLLLSDDDKAMEGDVPGDIRDAIRRVPYLHKVFDAWQMCPTEDIYILDGDCLLYKRPTDFPIGAYQATHVADDDEIGVALWRDLGVTMPRVYPRFVGGMFSARRSMWSSNLALIYEYTRECVRRGYDKAQYPGVVCEQSLHAGLWRTTYQDHPLDPLRYPINMITPDPVLWHVSSTKGTPYADLLVNAYKARFHDRQCL